MKLVKSIMEKADAFQQKHAYLAFPVAVIKRYGDDKAGRQAALITYYAFLALFPLLLVFITILNIVVGGSPDLQASISKHVFQYFPALGHDLQGSVHTLKGNGIALILELLALFYGARGLATMLQEAFNNVWHVEKEHRPGFVADNLRSFGMMASVGLGIILSTVVGYALSGVLDFGIVGSILVIGINLVFTIGLFLVVFRLGTSNSIGFSCLRLGAVIAALGVLVVQHFGNYIMAHELPKLQGTYGSFALALGMLFWIYLQAQIILYALEITTVRAQHDWPKKLF